MKRASVIFFIFYFSSVFGAIVNSLNREKTQISYLKAEKRLIEKKQNNLKGEDVYFKGDILKIDFKNKVNHLKGNVFIQDKTFLMKSKEAFLFYIETELGKKIERIEAFGDVYVLKSKEASSDEVEAYSQKVFYYPSLDKLSLYEKAKIIRSEDVILGNEMHYNLKTEELIGQKVSGYVKKDSSHEKS